jgi:hypothetical protein
MLNISKKTLKTHFVHKLLIKNFSKTLKFELPNDFISTYRHKHVNFGFNGLGELVYKRTYSRTKEDNTNEEWYETVQRVVEGTYSLLLYIVI